MHTRSISCPQENTLQIRSSLPGRRLCRRSSINLMKTCSRCPSMIWLRNANLTVSAQWSLCGLRSSSSFVAVTGLPPKTTLSQPNTILHVRPSRPPTQDESARADEFNPLVAAGSLPELSDSVKGRFAAVTRRVSDRVRRGSPASQPGDDVVITPLGTGSAIPTLTRNGMFWSNCKL